MMIMTRLFKRLSIVRTTQKASCCGGASGFGMAHEWKTTGILWLMMTQSADLSECIQALDPSFNSLYELHYKAVVLYGYKDMRSGTPSKSANRKQAERRRPKRRTVFLKKWRF